MSLPQDEKEANLKKMMEEMQKVQEAAKPGPQHAGLAKLVGEWDQTSHFKMEGMEPCTGTGTCKYRMMLGGRFLVADTDSTMKIKMPDGTTAEQPFQGFMLMGYDNVVKEYQMVWCDAMGSGIYVLTGKADASGKTVTFDGIAKDVMTPEGRPWRTVFKLDSDDQHTLELWDSHNSTKTLALMGTIVSKRKS
jgi:hypothetical protein